MIIRFHRTLWLAKKIDIVCPKCYQVIVAIASRAEYIVFLCLMILYKVDMR